MKWPLKKKLYVSFGIIIALMALLGGVVHLYLRDAERLLGEHQRYQTVALYAQTANSTMLQSRRHEKDFFAREGESKYLDLHAQRHGEFTAGLESMRKLLDDHDGELVHSIDAADAAFKKYHTAFETAVQAYQRRGSAESGLQAEFRSAAQSIERVADDLRDDNLTILVLQARRNEKDFLLRGDAKAAARARASIDQAQNHVSATPALAARSAQLLGLFDVYRTKFEAAEEAQNTLDSLRSELHGTTGAVEESLDRLLEQAKSQATKASQNSVAVLENTDTLMGGLFLVVIGFALVVGRVLSAQVVHGTSTLMVGTQRIAAGDLNTNVKVETSDELGELANAFNMMGSSLRSMSKDVTDASSSMNEMVRELQATVSEQGAALQQQASSVSETVATVEELARSSEQVSDIVNRVIESAARSVETSRSGRDAIQQSVGGMSDVRDQVEHIARTILDLSERTQQIGSIIATVDDFAEQSSLLALNASIEAARAGENGKAFAVVAAEVKSLAEQSQKATERVRAILSEIQRVTHTAVMVTEEGSKRVERGVGLVRGAGDIIASLASSIEASADSAKQIAAAARQQSNGIEQISVAMAGIDQFSRQNVEAIRQTETTSHTLAGVAQQLKSASAQYRL